MESRQGEERREEGRGGNHKPNVFLSAHHNIYWHTRKLFTLNPGKEPLKRTGNSFQHSHRDGNTASSDLEKWTDLQHGVHW